MEYTEKMRRNKLWVKILLAFPLLDVSWWVYRFLSSKEKSDGVGMILAVVLAILSLPVSWIIDILFLCSRKDVYWL